LSELNRPLDEKDSVKLFATNGLVDKYNRQCILQAKGQLSNFVVTSMDGKFTTGPSSPQLTTFPINPLTSLSDRFHNNTTGQYSISQSVGGAKKDFK
jgi:hypothetical protein